MIPITTYRRSESESIDDLRALLEGHVFHVAQLTSLPDILRTGAILPNPNCSLPSAFNRLNAFFRNRGCVSLFDYRAEPTKEIQDCRSRCPPLKAASPNGGIAIFVLKPSAYDALIPWTRWCDEGKPVEMIIPHVEAGFPGSLSLDLVCRVMTLELTEDPDSFMAMVRRCAK